MTVGYHPPRVAPDLAALYSRPVAAYEQLGAGPVDDADHAPPPRDGTPRLEEPPRPEPTRLEGIPRLEALWPEEAALMAKAVEGRRIHFAAGRHCARLALADLGLAPGPILVGPHRQPVWPPGIRASITHTEGYVAAVACSAVGGAGPDSDGRFGIGIDAEQVGRVTEHLWPRLFTDDERAWLVALPADERAVAATAVFGAKEALYKAQFPLTESWVGFHDVEARPVGERFSVETGLRFQPHSDLTVLDRLHWPVLGRHLLRGPIMVSAVAVESTPT